MLIILGFFSNFFFTFCSVGEEGADWSSANHGERFDSNEVRFLERNYDAAEFLIAFFFFFFFFRNAISKFHQMKAQLQAVSIRIQTMSSTAAMADAMKGAARAMWAQKSVFFFFFFFLFSL